MKQKISEKEKFFSKVSHDLRGSFTSILGFSDIVNDDEEEISIGDLKEYLGRIGKQSHESFELLSNFINWLKLEHFQYGITEEEIELVDMLYELKSNIQKDLKKKNVELEFDVDEKLNVFLDYVICQSILSNTFQFILKTCNESSKIFVKGFDENNSAFIEIDAQFEKNNTSYLQNVDLRDLNNELSFPIVFAIKFTELSGGSFNFSFLKNHLQIQIALPQN